jgi:hypothetical protein
VSPSPRIRCQRPAVAWAQIRVATSAMTRSFTTYCHPRRSHSAYSAAISKPRSARSSTVRRRASGKRATLWMRKSTAPEAVFVSPGRNRL